MSKKSKKLGRGLRELLNQREIQMTSSPSPVGDSFEKKKDLDSDFTNTTTNSELKFNSVMNETSHSDSFRFDSLKNDLQAAESEIKSLHEEVKHFTLDAFPANELKTNKTLMDYMNTEKSESEPIKPEILYVDHETATVQSKNTEAFDDVNRIYDISIGLIDSNPWQPRTVFSPQEINELAESLKTHGLLQPIVVRQYKNRYQLVAGERRFRAAMKLNWTKVPVTIIDATDREMAELALIENLQRKDLNPIEKATSFENYLKENNCTQDELAKRLNMDRSTISNLLRLLLLPPEVQQMVIEEKLTQGHARALLTLTKSQDQVTMAQRISDEKLSVRQTEQVVAEWNGKTVEERKNASIQGIDAPKSKSRSKEKSPHILDLERQLQDVLDLKVKISVDDSGKGKLEIFFANQNDFSTLLEYFR